jgi:hypothetical protein
MKQALCQLLDALLMCCCRCGKACAVGLRPAAHAVLELNGGMPAHGAANMLCSLPAEMLPLGAMMLLCLWLRG